MDVRMYGCMYGGRPQSLLVGREWVMEAANESDEEPGAEVTRPAEYRRHPGKVLKARQFHSLPGLGDVGPRPRPGRCANFCDKSSLVIGDDETLVEMRELMN